MPSSVPISPDQQRPYLSLQDGNGSQRNPPTVSSSLPEGAADSRAMEATFIKA